MKSEEFTQGWYNWLSWYTDSIGTLAKEASDLFYQTEEFMDNYGMKKFEPGYETLVKLFLLSEAMEDEEFKAEIEHLKNRFADVWDIRHKPDIVAGRWGIESEEEDC